MQPSDKNRKITLPTLLRVPNAKELEGMLLQSIAHRGEMLELNFQSSGTRTHILQAITGRRAGEGAPTWYLYSDDEGEGAAVGESNTSGAAPGQGSQSSSSHNSLNNARSILKPPRNPNAFKPMEQTLEWIHQTGDINHLLSLIESALVENQKRQSDTGNKPEFVPYSQAVTKPAPATKAYRPVQFENVEHFKGGTSSQRAAFSKKPPCSIWWSWNGRATIARIARRAPRDLPCFHCARVCLQFCAAMMSRQP